MAGASRDPQFCVHIKQMRRRTDKGQPDCVTWGQNHPLAQDANDLALVVSCDKIDFCARRFDHTDPDWKSVIVINRHVFGADTQYDRCPVIDARLWLDRHVRQVLTAHASLP